MAQEASACPHEGCVQSSFPCVEAHTVADSTLTCSAALWNTWATGDRYSESPTLRDWWYLGAPSNASAPEQLQATGPSYSGRVPADRSYTFTCSTDPALQWTSACGRDGTW